MSPHPASENLIWIIRFQAPGTEQLVWIEENSNLALLLVPSSHGFLSCRWNVKKPESKKKNSEVQRHGANSNIKMGEAQRWKALKGEAQCNQTLSIWESFTYTADLLSILICNHLLFLNYKVNKRVYWLCTKSVDRNYWRNLIYEHYITHRYHATEDVKFEWEMISPEHNAWHHKWENRECIIPWTILEVLFAPDRQDVATLVWGYFISQVTLYKTPQNLSFPLLEKLALVYACILKCFPCISFKEFQIFRPYITVFDQGIFDSCMKCLMKPI